MQQADGEPYLRGVTHGVERADLSDQAAGAHACAAGDIGHLEADGSNRGEDCAGERGRYPNQRVFHDVGHLQHTGSQALAEQARPAVFFETHHGEADHLRAAADGGRACRQAAE